MKSSQFVIAGGGMVAGYAARQLVKMGMPAEALRIVSVEDAIPYERPPLSKGLLSGQETPEKIQIEGESFYREHGIGLLFGHPITRLDVGLRVLRLASGEEVGFEKLLLATGARARRMDIPGASLGNVFYLRSLRDSLALRAAAKEAKRAAVIGGGFIGMEVASVLAQMGLKTTMIVRDDKLARQLFTPAMSTFFEKYYADRGVHILKGASVQELRGTGMVQSAVLGSGDCLDCDLVVAGVGAEPVLDPFAGCGLEMENGILVDEYLETSIPGIYAAGDIANYQDVLFGKRRRTEHWDNAVSQGEHCAKAMMGERAEFVHVPYFFSDVFDLSYEFWGDTSVADRFVERGDLDSTSFSVWWMRGETVVGAFVMNRQEDRDRAQEAIAEKTSFDSLAN